MSVSAGNPLQIVTCQSTEAVSKYRIVGLETPTALIRKAGLVADTVLPFGVSLEAASASGKDYSVAVEGEVLVEHGGGTDIAGGDFLMTDGSGKAIAATTGKWAIGFALEPATADGDLIRMQIFRYKLP